MKTLHTTNVLVIKDKGSRPRQHSALSRLYVEQPEVDKYKVGYTWFASLGVSIKLRGWGGVAVGMLRTQLFVEENYPGRQFGAGSGVDNWPLVSNNRVDLNWNFYNEHFTPAY